MINYEQVHVHINGIVNAETVWKIWTPNFSKNNFDPPVLENVS